MGFEPISSGATSLTATIANTLSAINARPYYNKHDGHFQLVLSGLILFYHKKWFLGSNLEKNTWKRCCFIKEIIYFKKRTSI